MRIRRTLIAPIILTIGTVGSLVAGPVLAIATAAAPTAATAASAQVAPDMFVYHG